MSDILESDYEPTTARLEKHERRFIGVVVLDELTTEGQEMVKQSKEREVSND